MGRVACGMRLIGPSPTRHRFSALARRGGGFPRTRRAGAVPEPRAARGGALVVAEGELGARGDGPPRPEGVPAQVHVPVARQHVPHPEVAARRKATEKKGGPESKDEGGGAVINECRILVLQVEGRLTLTVCSSG